MPERRRADLLHCHLQFRAQDFEHAVHTRLTKGAKTPQVWSSDSDTFSAHAERFDQVGTAAKAGINQHKHVAGYLYDLGQRFDGGSSGLVGATAMI